MTTRESIEAAIAALQSVGIFHPTISLVLGRDEDEPHPAWDAIKAMGGRPESTLYRHLERDPYVIDSLRLFVGDVEVSIQQGREPTEAEKERTDITHNHNQAFVSTDL